MSKISEGYKQTELGVIPGDWDIKFLNDISVITRLAGYEYSSMWEESEDGEIIALRGFNIGKNQIIDKDFARISNKLSIRLKRSRLLKGNVVYPCVGTIGNAAVIAEDDKYHIQQNIAKIVPNNNIIDSYYLAHYLMSPAGLNEINKFNGTSSQPNILVGSLRKYSILLPPYAEQISIATALSDADALIQSLEKLITKRHAIKQGVMQELLTGKKRLPGFEKNKGYRQTDVGIIPEDWEVFELGDIINLTQLGGNYPNTNIETLNPLIKMGNLGRGNIIIDKLEYIIDTIKPLEKDRLNFGDVLFNTRNTLDLVGKIAIWRDELPKAYFNSNILRFKFNTKYVSSNQFMNYILNTQATIVQLRSIATGTTSVAAIYTRDLIKIKVPLPTPTEQTAIAIAISEMNDEISVLETKLVKYKQIKQSMIQNLLTGRIRLV